MPNLIEVDKKILLFSHREISLFNLLFFFNPKILKHFKENYIIIIHLGGYIKSFKIPDWCDYLFTTPGNIKKLKGDIQKRVNICSRDVLPTCFFNKGNEFRKWDAIYISNNSINKRVREYFDLVRKCKEYNFCLVLSYSENDSPIKFDNDLIQEIETYSSQQSSNLTFFPAVKNKNGSYSISREKISEILNSSKVYIHFCRREGESRSIGEALASGCFVLLRHDMIGGANDICDNENSSRFSSLEEANKILDTLIEQSIDHHKQSESYEKKRNEALSVLKDIFISIGCSRRSVENFVLRNDLSMLLPGHVKPAYKTDGSNADIESLDELFLFLNFFNIRPKYLSVKMAWYLKFIFSSVIYKTKEIIRFLKR